MPSGQSGTDCAPSMPWPGSSTSPRRQWEFGWGNLGWTDGKEEIQPQVPDTLKNLVQDVGKPVSSSDVDSYGKLRQIQDRSHQIRTIVKAWKDQQVQDRNMRERYATYLIVAMAMQALVVNGVFVLMGCGVLTFEAW